MPSNPCFPSKKRGAEFSPLRPEKPGDFPENKRRLDSLEGHPPQEPKETRLELPQSQLALVVGKTQTSGRTEEVVEAKPSGDNRPAKLRPCPDFKTGVFRPPSQNASQRDALAASSEKRKDGVERRINLLMRQQVFFPPPRPATPPRTPTPHPPPQPSPVRDSSPEVTRVLYPLGTDWRTFFNYNEEDAGDAEYDDDFEDDDEEPFDFEALHRYLETVPEDDWDDD